MVDIADAFTEVHADPGFYSGNSNDCSNQVEFLTVELVKTINSLNMDSRDLIRPALPAKRSDDSIDPKPAHASLRNREGFAEQDQCSDQKSFLILVADDDPMIRLLAQQALGRGSFDILQAENGKEAIEIFEAESPDLILSDVMMPVVNGFELCTAIRAMKQGEHVPIVMLTGLNDAESIECAFSAGATDFCEKPVNWELLPYKLNYILRASTVFRKLQASEERYSLVARGANDGLWDWDYKNNRVQFSPRWESMLGFKEGSIGSDPDEWIARIHPEDRNRVVVELEAQKKAQTSHFECEYRIKNANDSYRWMMCRGLAVRDEDGIAYRMTGSQSDITERKRAEEKLTFDAVHDALTGLPNRVLFFDRLNHCIELSARRKNFSFALLYLDLNRFKIINDSLGHLLGDQLLVEVSLRIKDIIRKGDTLSRLGGDEFVILCEEVDDISVVTSLADRIQGELLKPVDLNGQRVVVGCSIGITESSIGYEHPEDMLRDADAAMYRAKASTSSPYEIFDLTMHKKAMNVLQTEADLRVALKEEEFEVHYQPIINIEKDEVSGFEALVRWNHPKSGLCLPAEFLEVAIESRLIVPLGRWVLAQACRQMQAWKEQWEEAAEWTVNVNLSAVELSQPDLISTIHDTIAESGLAPKFLKLEITETSLIKNSSHALSTMNSLRDRGIHLSIDDFGTGYSSFSYLHQFPFDELKIDRSFISELDKRPDKRKIVNAIVSLAHNLGMTVVAEGTTSGEIYENLRGASCEYAQGFSILEPKSANEIGQALLDTLSQESHTGSQLA